MNSRCLKRATSYLIRHTVRAYSFDGRPLPRKFGSAACVSLCATFDSYASERACVVGQPLLSRIPNFRTPYGLSFHHFGITLPRVHAVEVYKMSSSDAEGPQNQSTLPHPNFPGEDVQTNRSAATVSQGPPRPAEGSGVEASSNHPSASENNAPAGTKAQSQHENEKPSNKRNVSAMPPLFDEIRLLQERLLYLEDRATQQWQATVEDAPLEDNRSGRRGDDQGSSDDEELRKHIRKAPSGRRWVETIEQHAEEGADERKDYGHEPSKVLRGKTKGTMYNIQEDGELLHKPELEVVFGPEGWMQTHGYPYHGFTYSNDLRLRERVKPVPQRSVRPPTNLRPFYEAPVRKGLQTQTFDAPPLRLSRKLGPTTRWDGSDSDEWSSDTSTRSKDFKYFRSRLRGDFEWELDRLNAQVLRYKKHKNKMRSRQVANQTQEENKRLHEELGSHDQHIDLLAKLDLDAEATGIDKYGIPQLNPLEWPAFRLRRALPLQYSCVIDVLIEEPNISSNLEGRGRLKREKKEKKPHKTDNLETPVVEDIDSKDGAAQSLNQATTWMEQDPLPERIRINSKQIIGALSSMHGSPLCLDTDEDPSVVLLRPFRFLNAYDKEIREMCSKLEDAAVMEPELPVPVGEGIEQKGTKSDVVPDQESLEESPGSNDKARVEENEEKPTGSEEDVIKREHLTCLRQFMDDYTGRKVAYLNSVSCNKIFFSDVWHLFQPGTTVISAEGKQAYRVINVKSKPHKGSDRWAAFWDRRKKKTPEHWGSSSDSSDGLYDDRRADIIITCAFIHFDGQKFGPVIQTFQMNKWGGEKEITYLEIYPIRFHVLKHLDKRSLSSSSPTSSISREQEVEKGIQALRQKLIDRGRVFLDVAAMKHMYYSGLAVDTRDEIESQVMVDFEEALAHETRKGWIPRIVRLVGSDWKSKTDEAEEGCAAECCWQENVHDDAYVEANNTEKFMDDLMAEIKDIPHKLPSAIVYPRRLEETKVESNAWTDDELMVMSYSVFGFVLRDRTWGKCPHC